MLTLLNIPTPTHLLAILVLALGAVLVLLLAAPLSNRPVVSSAIGVVTTLVAAVVALVAPGTAGLAVLALCAVAAVALLLVPPLARELQEQPHTVEATALLLLGTAGAVALATAGDLVQTVVGVETLALSSVTLVALTAGERPLEAAFKYLVLGGIALATMLYGVGLVYLGTGSLAFPTLASLSGNDLAVAGVLLIALGLAFELAVVPFHWGALDAYTAAAPGLAGFVMSASKIGAAYALGKLAVAAGVPVQQVLIWIGALTIAWGTIGALAQQSLRRLLAYSAVTHAGFIALAVGSGPVGPTTAVFYAAVYGAMAMLTFAALAGLGVEPDPSERLADGRLGPIRAGALALGLVSLSGVPPTPGFWAKLAVLAAAWQYAGPVATLIAVAGGVLAVLYYLRPLPDLFATIKAGFAPQPAAGRPAALPSAGIALAATLVVVLSFAPGLAWGAAQLFAFGG